MRFLMLIAFAVACSRTAEQRQDPETGAGESRPAVMPPPKLGKTEVGRWKSESGDLCFELFKNGDFQLSFPNERQKVQVLGRTEVLSTRGGLEDKFLLKVERIWFARYVSNCRKHVIDGHWADSYAVAELGATFEKAKNVDITFKMSDDNHMEMCATKCTKLTREASALYGRWRVDALNRNTDGMVWPADEVIDFELDRDSRYAVSVWIGDGTKDIVRLRGKVEQRVIDTDRYHDSFEIVMTVDDKPRSFTAARLPGEKLRVCNGEHCTTLERMFRDHDP